jgi:uncharacterized RDD family membrane protein YckC
MSALERSPDTVAASSVDSAGTRASGPQRFLTVILDTAFVYVFAFLIGILLAIFGLSRALETLPEFLFGITIYALYYIPQEFFSGRTLGKRIMKTRVVRFDGAPATFGQVVGRTFCRFIPFEFASFFGTQERGGPLGWHDKIPRTVVITTGAV